MCRNGASYREVSCCYHAKKIPVESFELFLLLQIGFAFEASCFFRKVTKRSLKNHCRKSVFFSVTHLRETVQTQNPTRL